MRKSRLREVGSQRSHNQEVANLGSEKKPASFTVHDPQHQGRLDFERRNWKNENLLFLSRWLLPWNHGNKTLEGTTWHERCGIPAPEHVLLTVVSFLRHRQPSRAWATNCGQLPEAQEAVQSMSYQLWSASWGTGSLPEHELLTVVSFLRHRKALFQCVSIVPSVALEDYHRGPVQSLLQNRRSLLPVAED